MAKRILIGADSENENHLEPPTLFALELDDAFIAWIHSLAEHARVLRAEKITAKNERGAWFAYDGRDEQDRPRTDPAAFIEGMRRTERHVDQGRIVVNATGFRFTAYPHHGDHTERYESAWFPVERLTEQEPVLIGGEVEELLSERWEQEASDFLLDLALEINGAEHYLDSDDKPAEEDEPGPAPA